MLVILIYCHLQRYKSYYCWLHFLLILAKKKNVPMMQLLCLCILITLFFWVPLMSLQSFDATTFTEEKKLDWEWRSREHASVCHHQVYIYIFSCESLSVVGQKINMTHAAEVFPGSQVLYHSAVWVIMLSTRKSSIVLLLLPLCLWEWCEALSRV